MSIVRRWRLQPLRRLEADVPLAYRIGNVLSTTAVAVTLNIGDTVTIDSSGLVRNAHGTVLFRLEHLSLHVESGTVEH